MVVHKPVETEVVDQAALVAGQDVEMTVWTMVVAAGAGMGWQAAQVAVVELAKKAVEEVALLKGPGLRVGGGGVGRGKGAVEGRKCENPWQDALEREHRICLC